MLASGDQDKGTGGSAFQLLAVSGLELSIQAILQSHTFPGWWICMREGPL